MAKCIHTTFVEITNLDSADREFVCSGCGHQWSEPRTVGSVMRHLVDDAHERAPLAIDRVWNFDDTQDSDGEGWDDPDKEATVVDALRELFWAVVRELRIDRAVEWAACRLGGRRG